MDMTFSELFAQHGFHRMCDVCAAVTHPSGRKLSKAHLSMIWYGHNNLGANLAKLISEGTGIPVGDLILAIPDKPPGRRGRPKGLTRRKPDA
jgi:hypothetical protein